MINKTKHGEIKTNNPKSKIRKISQNMITSFRVPAHPYFPKHSKSGNPKILSYKNIPTTKSSMIKIIQGETNDTEILMIDKVFVQKK